MNLQEFHQLRQFADVSYGRIAYIERGRTTLERDSPPPAVFLHGLPLNGFQWREVIARVSTDRRCIAPDMMGLGYSEVSDIQDLSPSRQAEMLAAFLDALSAPVVDLIANDSGGAIAQLFVARYPQRVRSLLLTNCDVHEDSPPAALQPFIDAARAGVLADQFIAAQLANKAMARGPDGVGGQCYARPQTLTDEAIDCYFAPLVSSPLRKAQLHRYVTSLEPNPLPAIAPLLRQSAVPVRLVWGTADQFFSLAAAEWLDRTFPKSQGIRRVEGGKVFFVEEQPDLIAQEARALWRAQDRAAAFSQ
jgi:haloalkane dehalogenase